MDLNLLQLAEFYKMFGDETRLKILFQLDEGEKCVCDLCDALDMNQSAVSHQLKNLKAARLVAARKDGKHVFYSFDDDHVRQIFGLGLSHLQHK